VRFHVESTLKEYKDRFLKHYDELKWLCCELYGNQQDMFES
jgi:hypothetical protein